MSSDQREWNVLSMLEWATDYFESKNIPDPRHSIEWLMAHTLDMKRLDLYVNFERPLSPSELDTLRPLVKRRAQHEPLQYITGSTDFMNAHINVTPDVLIPRIETEQLAEIILDDHAAGSLLHVLDIGTGSGCIPIALKMERPEWTIFALDISNNALAIARENAEQNETDIQLVKADLNHPDEWPFSDSFDVIISNPPYILPDEKSSLEPQVKSHEPGLALFCDDINKIYGNIAKAARQYLKPNGELYLEINEQYAEQIQARFSSKTWTTELIKDYAKKQRFIKANLRQ